MAALDSTPASLAVSKLVARGRESATKLEALIRGAPPMEQLGRMGQVAAEIIRCFDSALSALQHDAVVDWPVGSDGSSASGRKRKSGPGRAAATQAARPKTRRTRGSSEVPPTRRVVEKQWTAEDGFMWRKYGHKVIMNSSHPRLYFRCSYKQESGCLATRQVQQSEDDPSLYVITYFGQHTCCVCREDVETQPPFAVVNFGSTTSSSGDAAGGDRIKNKELGRLQAKESTSSHNTQPAHASCSSSAWEWDPCSDYFGDTLCDYVTQLFSFDDDNARLYCH